MKQIIFTVTVNDDVAISDELVIVLSDALSSACIESVGEHSIESEYD